MPYRLKISGLQYESEIEGSQDWTRSVTRDFNDRLFRTRGEYRFTGHKGLYNLLYNHLSINGACESLEGRIYFKTDCDSWDYEWRGDIKPQDFEFDLLKRSADGQISDASWASRFNNTDEQKVFLRSRLSRVGEIMPLCNTELCDFYDPSTGSFDFEDRRCFRVYDVFTFLVSFYSNTEVSFASDFFALGGDGDQYYITTGKEIRTGDNSANPEISFRQLFTEMNKKLNLWIIIDVDDLDNPVLRIEPWEYVFKNEKLVEMRDPENIKLTTDLDQLYSTVKVGSEAVNYGETDANYPNARYLAWNNEEYNSTDECNFENNSLDLVSTFKIDTNSIEQQLDAGASDGDHDDSIFIVEIDPTTQNAFQFTTDYTTTDTVSFIYNFNLTNEQVILNWFEGIPQSLEKSLFSDISVYVDTFTYTGNASTPQFNDIIFTNDSTAPANDPDNVYTTPAEDVTHQGEFFAYATSFYDVFGAIDLDPRNGNNEYSIVATVYEDDTRATIVSRTTIAGPVQLFPFGFPGYPGITRIDGRNDVFMFAGNVMVLQVKMKFSALFWYDIYNAYATVDIAPITYNLAPDDPLIYIYKAERHAMTRTDFDTMDQGRGFVRIIDTHGEKYYDCWAKDVQWNSNTCVIESGEFIGGRPPTELCWVLQTGSWNDSCYYLDSKYWPS